MCVAERPQPAGAAHAAQAHQPPRHDVPAGAGARDRALAARLPQLPQVTAQPSTRSPTLTYTATSPSGSVLCLNPTNQSVCHKIRDSCNLFKMR